MTNLSQAAGRPRGLPGVQGSVLLGGNAGASLQFGYSYPRCLWGAKIDRYCLFGGLEYVVSPKIPPYLGQPSLHCRSRLATGFFESSRTHCQRMLANFHPQNDS